MPYTYPETQEERDELRARNLGVFKKYDSALAQRLETHVPATELVFDEDGQPDMLFQGQKFYDGRYNEYVDEQIEEYKNKSYRFFLAVPQPSNLDIYGAQFLANILARSTVELKAEFSRHFSSLKTFFVTVFGIGLGRHLDEIAAMSDCTIMIICDPNIESLYHSLEVFDWEPLFEERAAKRGLVLFLIGDNSQSHFSRIKAYVRSLNTPGVDGMLIYQHYNNAIFAEIMKEISKQGDLFLAGLGFYKDECKMIVNTHKNLAGGTAHIYNRRNDALIPYPCFIVGCGPSLDGDLKYIKENENSAIIISSGSAMGPLLNAGITPDFQLEVENEGILPIMQHVAEKHEISDICLVTSTTVEPQIVDYFKRIIYHFRPALAPYSIISENPNNTIPYHDPSVVNSSLGFAQDLGFREFYFFGCDMGTRNSDSHHARNSYHFAPDARLPNNDFSIRVPANFGGDTYTSTGLNWVKSNLEVAMLVKRQGRTYYNCSDGAFLDGAVAKFAKAISLPTPENPSFKKDCVQAAIDQCPVMDTETFAKAWQQDVILAGFDAFFDELENIINGATFLIDKDYLLDMNRVLNHAETPLTRGIGTWLRGTIQMMLLAVEFYSNRLKTTEVEMAFEEVIREELLKTLNQLREESRDLVKTLA